MSLGCPGLQVVSGFSFHFRVVPGLVSGAVALRTYRYLLDVISATIDRGSYDPAGEELVHLVTCLSGFEKNH